MKHFFTHAEVGDGLLIEDLEGGHHADVSAAIRHMRAAAAQMIADELALRAGSAQLTLKLVDASGTAIAAVKAVAVIEGLELRSSD